MWTDWEKKVKPDAKIPLRLLWDVDLKKFDWEKGKDFVVERVIEYGMPEDYYTLFKMYGGVEGVREIIKTIRHFRCPKDVAFVCMAFDLRKEEMEYYKQQQEKKCFSNCRQKTSHWNGILVENRCFYDR